MTPPKKTNYSRRQKQNSDVAIHLNRSQDECSHEILWRCPTTSAKLSRSTEIIVIIFEIGGVSQGKSFLVLKFFKVATYHRPFLDSRRLQVISPRMSLPAGVQHSASARAKNGRVVYLRRTLVVRLRFSVVFIIHLLDFGPGLDHRSPEGAMCR
jgi:hypothetical protein